MNAVYKLEVSILCGVKFTQINEFFFLITHFLFHEILFSMIF